MAFHTLLRPLTFFTPSRGCPRRSSCRRHSRNPWEQGQSVDNGQISLHEVESVRNEGVVLEVPTGHVDQLVHGPKGKA